MKNEMSAAPVLIKIGKTIYTATPTAPAAAGIKRSWSLVATKGCRKAKSLFESDHGFTLWSAHNGLRGPGAPKSVDVHFMGELTLVA